MIPTPACQAAYDDATRLGVDPARRIGLVMFGPEFPLFEGDPEWSGERPTWSRTHYANEIAAACRLTRAHAAQAAP